MRFWGTMATLALASAICTTLDPKRTMGAWAAFEIVVASGFIGYLLGDIAENLRNLTNGE